MAPIQIRVYIGCVYEAFFAVDDQSFSHFYSSLPLYATSTHDPETIFQSLKPASYCYASLQSTDLT